MQALDLAGRRVLVLGLGASGRSAAAFLAARGARVLATDERSADALGDLSALAGRVELMLGLPFPDPSAFDLVVPSPGVPATRWAGARRALGDVELAGRALSVPIVAITGTNGKTTTTALTAAMLRAAGLRAQAAGNIGLPALELVGRPLDVAVFEVSSFQLEATEAFRPRVAVVLNVEPDHLDRHGDFATYVAAKARLLAHQRTDDEAVLNGEDPVVEELAAATRAHVRFFRTQGSVADGASWDAGAVVLHEGGRRTRLRLDLPDPANAPPLPDVLAALLACRALGADIAKAAAALTTFSGPAHRREVVARREGVTWVNDSKATNPAAAALALRELAAPAVWLAGGRNKGLAFDSLADAASGRARVALLFGEAAGAIEEALEGRVPAERVPDLEHAVARAAELAQPGDVVLLSPACASFDQFKNYEERGERFRAAVAELEKAARGPA